MSGTPYNGQVQVTTKESDNAWFNKCELCEGGEGGEGLKWFDMHVIVFVTSIAFK